MKKTISLCLSLFMIFVCLCQSNMVVHASDEEEELFTTSSVYTVTFDTRGGSEIAPQFITSGGKAELPSQPVMDGDVHFNGWYTDETWTSCFDFDTPITKDTTIYARWSYPVSLGTYDITNHVSGRGGVYNYHDRIPDVGYIDDPVNYNTDIYLAEGAADVIADPVLGSRFIGWYEGALDDFARDDWESAVELVSENPKYEFVLSGPRSLYAVFEWTYPVTLFDIPEEEVTLCGKDNIQLAAVIEPSEESDCTVRWSSTKPSVATVDENGLVTAVSPGKTTIQARLADDGRINDSCEITVEFGDVPSGHVRYQAVSWGIENNITKGYQETNTFGVNDPCTRGQFMMFLWRLAGKPSPSRTDNAFSDVPKGHAFFKAVMWARRWGLPRDTQTVSPVSRYSDLTISATGVMR